MAKLKGPIKIKGTIGEMTFSKTEDGYIVRDKTSIDGKRIATDPVFQRTRENNAEFGRAGKASKVLRNAVRTLLQHAKDSRTTSRLTAAMMRVLKADTVSARGMRNVMAGEPGLLEGFDFNKDATLGATISAPFVATIDRPAGILAVVMQPFNPSAQLAAPAGATHFKMVSMAVEADFTNEKAITGASETAVLPWDSNNTAIIRLENTITASSTLPLFLLFGVQFFQQVNGINYPLKNGTFNTLNLVKVSKG